MASRNRPRKPGRASAATTRVFGKKKVALALPLVIMSASGTVVITGANPDLSGSAAQASTSPTPSSTSSSSGLVGGIVNGLLPTASPSPKSSSQSSSSSSSSSGGLIGGVTSGVSGLLGGLLPSSSPTPSPSSSGSRGSSGSGTTSGSSGSSAPKKSSPKSGSKTHSADPTVPAPVSAAPPETSGSIPGSGSTSTAQPSQQAVGYDLPVSRSLVAKDPQLIGEGSPVPSKAEPAGPVTLSVPAGTEIDAVTAGTLRVVQDGRTQAIVLSGADGATYTYKNVAATEQAIADQATPGHSATSGHGATPGHGARTVPAGTKIGVSRPGAVSFTITVPDVAGPVDADQALQAWASGLTVDVRSLPTTVGGTDTPAKQQVMLLSDSGASGATASLARSLTSSLVQTTTKTLPSVTSALASAETTVSKVMSAGLAADPELPADLIPSASAYQDVADSAHTAQDQASRLAASAQKLIAAAPHKLIVVSLAKGTPLQAAAFAKDLPRGRDLLWIAPADTTAEQAKQYQAIAAAHPGFRIETLPSALAKAGNSPAAQQAVQSAETTLTAQYESNAYQLNTDFGQAQSVLAWAEAQLGKPYKWAAAGPGSFDCSGLVMDALAQAGISVPHNANAQWRQTKKNLVSPSQLQPGDLVFFAGSDGTSQAPGHVGIYVGHGEVLDAPYTGANVRFDPLSSIAGYVGATDPYYATPTPGATAFAAAQMAALSVPTALSKYQAFAEELSSSTWGSGQFPYLYELWVRESGWNPSALNPKSGAFGIPQALPATKMSTAGLDWATDPYTQIEWGIGYIEAAYGTPGAAWAHEEAYGWY
jgi:cell wall-associated NlpC family hydrolase